MNDTVKHLPVFIAVEGPIGVGKTTLAHFLASRYKYHLLKEIVEENPFLSKFYDDIQKWSFQTEMFFLCNRYKQLEDIQQHYLGQGQSVVADYHIFKNLIFAHNTLSSAQFSKYRQVYNILVSDLPRPNLVVYLKASLTTLLKRIKARGRSFELNMDPIYLDHLRLDYDRVIMEFQQENPEVPVLTYNGDELDFVMNNQDLEHIYRQIEEVLQLE